MKPILFNTEMVRAILDGRKTCTRRVVKPQPRAIYHDGTIYEDDGCYVIAEDQNGTPEQIGLPYCPGDILYVRETWCSAYDGERYFYLSDKHTDREEKQLLDYNDVKWRPSIHMPKEAARIFLRVTNVRGERLQEITDKQAMEEGIGAYWILGTGENGYAVSSGSKTLYEGPIGAFSALWNTTIKPADLPLYGWEANPWVWVIEFNRCEKQEEGTR